HRPRMSRLAGRQFDGWLPCSPTPGDYSSGLRAVRRAADDAGRDPDSVVAAADLTVAVADRPPAATAEFDAYMNAYYGLPAEVTAQVQACHAGTFDSAADWVASYRDAGASHVILRLATTRLADHPQLATALLEAIRGRVADSG